MNCLKCQSSEVSYNKKQTEYRKDLYKKNSKKIIDRARMRRKTDLSYRLKVNLRARLAKALTIRHPASTTKSLGCTVGELKKYLQSKFQLGMSWDNYGKWEIDHIRPLASFDLIDKTQYQLACHYSNLQPLWASDNRKKSVLW